MQSAEGLVDSLKVEAAKASTEVDQIRLGCESLQDQLVNHQRGLERQIGEWQSHLKDLLVEFERQLTVKIAGIDSDDPPAFQA